MVCCIVMPGIRSIFNIMKNENPEYLDQKTAIEEDPFTIAFLKDPPLDIQLDAVKKTPYTLRFIKNPCDEVINAAIDHNDFHGALAYLELENQDEHMHMKIVRKGLGRYINFFKNPTRLVIEEAIKKDPDVIDELEEHHLKDPLLRDFVEEYKRRLQFNRKHLDSYTLRPTISPPSVNINNLDLEEQKAMVKRDKTSMRYITNPSLELQRYYLEVYPYNVTFFDINNPDDSITIELLKRHQGLEHVKNPTKEMIDIALAIDGRDIRYIKNPTEENIYTALRSRLDHYVIRYIKNPTEYMKYLSILNDPFSIKYIDNPSDYLKTIAVLSQPTIAGCVELSEDLQLRICGNSHYNMLLYFKNPSRKVIAKAVSCNRKNLYFIRDSNEAAQILREAYLLRTGSVEFSDTPIKSFDPHFMQTKLQIKLHNKYF